MSETAINYVCAEAPGIRVAGLLKLKDTFVSPIVAESLCLVSSFPKKKDKNASTCGRFFQRIFFKLQITDAKCMLSVRSSDVLYLS